LLCRPVALVLDGQLPVSTEFAAFLEENIL